MELARSLSMTLKQLFDNADSRELGLWISLHRLEHEERSAEERGRGLAAKAMALHK
jgi:hypothetical protein